MSVSTEVSELRVKVAELQNDLWHMSSQKEAAVASTQSLIQVVSNLAKGNSHESPSPHPARVEKDVAQQAELDEIKLRYDECQGIIKKLQEQLAASEKRRRNVQVVARNLASKQSHTNYAGDFSEDEGSLADDESYSSHLSRHRAKRTRKASTSKRGRSYSRDRLRPFQAGSPSAIQSTPVNVAVPVVERPKQVSTFDTKEKAAKKAEDARLMKLKLEKLQQLKRAQPATSGLTDRFSRIPMIRGPVISKDLSSPKLETTSEKEEPCLGSILKGQPFKESKLSETTNLISPEEQVDHKTVLELASATAVESVAPQGKRKRNEVMDLNDFSKSRNRRTGEIELNYDEDDNSENYGLVYKNEDEIDLGTSEDDGEGSPNQEDTTSLTMYTSPSIPMEFYQVPEPYIPLSPRLKYVDTVPCPWDSDDSYVSTKPRDVVPQKKSPPPTTPEEIEADRIEKAKWAKLLGPWEPPEEVEIVLAKFREPEESTVYRCPPYQERKPDSLTYSDGTPFHPVGSVLSSLNSERNMKLWTSTDERGMALNQHLSEEKTTPGFFKHGLFYVPSNGEKYDGDIYKTVHIDNLSDETTIGDLMARIRGGMVVSASIMDTKKLLGAKSAQVVFMTEFGAARYESYAKENPIFFGKNKAQITILDTPTYPLPNGLLVSIERYGHTRCLQIYGYPKHRIPDKQLVFDLTSKTMSYSSIPDGSRAAAMEEPYYNPKTGVMTLAFASVELAGSAFGILTTWAAYRALNLRPVFVEDPCDGPWEDLEPPPPMASELAVEGAKPTPLQFIQNSFKAQDKASQNERNMMPEVPSFGFQMPAMP